MKKLYISIFAVIMVMGLVGAVGIDNPDIPLAKKVDSIDTIIANLTSNYSLDSDKVDGYDASAFAKLYENNNFTHNMTISHAVFNMIGSGGAFSFNSNNGNLAVATSGSILLDSSFDANINSDSNAQISAENEITLISVDDTINIISGGEITDDSDLNVQVGRNILLNAGNTTQVTNNLVGINNNNASFSYYEGNGTLLTDVAKLNVNNYFDGWNWFGLYTFGQGGMYYDGDIIVEHNAGNIEFGNSNYGTDIEGDVITIQPSGSNAMNFLGTQMNYFKNMVSNNNANITTYKLTANKIDVTEYIDAILYYGNGSQLTGVCLANGTNCIASGGNPFNQDLNTTNNITAKVMNASYYESSVKTTSLLPLQIIWSKIDGHAFDSIYNVTMNQFGQVSYEIEGGLSTNKGFYYRSPVHFEDDVFFSADTHAKFGTGIISQNAVSNLDVGSTISISGDTENLSLLYYAGDDNTFWRFGTDPDRDGNIVLAKPPNSANLGYVNPYIEYSKVDETIIIYKELIVNNDTTFNGNVTINGNLNVSGCIIYNGGSVGTCV